MAVTPEFAVADSETDPFLFGRVPKPFIWGYFDGLVFKTFRETKQFIAYVSKLKITIYMHNGGKFDMMFLLDYVDSYQKPTIINNRISKIKIGKCTFVDSYNILPIALSDFQKDEIDYTKFEEEVRETHMGEITDYLRSDCVYLHEIVKAYRDEFGNDLTVAGGAMKTFQAMKNEKMPRHTDASLFANFKQFYSGGRVQAFKTGIIEADFSVYDINSAYPAAMMNFHPYGLDFVYGDRELPFTETERVFYRLSCISNGAFPYREKPTSGIQFPTDDIEREYCITDWEYWTAKNAGLMTDVKIIECVLFQNTMNFSDYVTEFYEGRNEAKRNGDKKKDLLYKLKLNSLYGKFGSDYRKYENNIILPNDIDVSEWEEVGDFGAMNKLFSRPLDDADMKFYNVATAASITGFVRAYLLATIYNVGFENVLYCDTDSIAVLNSAPLNKIPTGKLLGQWKNEGSFTRAGIGGKKLYVFKKNKNCPIYKDEKKKKPGTKGYKIACKGAVLTEGEMWKVCNGKTVTNKRDSPSFSVTGKCRFQERNIKMTK